MAQYHPKDWKPSMMVHEDNSTAIMGVKTGKNPTMKTLERGHGVSISWLHEKCCGDTPEYQIIHTGTKDMTADLYTKRICDEPTWNTLRRLINVFHEKEVKDFKHFDVLHTEEFGTILNGH